MEAKLCYIGYGLMENRSGLIVDARLTLPWSRVMPTRKPHEEGPSAGFTDTGPRERSIYVPTERLPLASKYSGCPPEK